MRALVLAAQLRRRLVVAGAHQRAVLGEEPAAPPRPSPCRCCGCSATKIRPSRRVSAVGLAAQLAGRRSDRARSLTSGRGHLHRVAAHQRHAAGVGAQVDRRRSPSRTSPCQIRRRRCPAPRRRSGGSTVSRALADLRRGDEQRGALAVLEHADHRVGVGEVASGRSGSRRRRRSRRSRRRCPCRAAACRASRPSPTSRGRRSSVALNSQEMMSRSLTVRVFGLHGVAPGGCRSDPCPIFSASMSSRLSKAKRGCGHAVAAHGAAGAAGWCTSGSRRTGSWGSGRASAS